MEIKLGQEARDKVTGFTGILVAKVEYLYGCTQYGIVPKVKEDSMETKPTEFFDEGRIEIIGSGINPKSVQGEVKGGINRDVPRAR